MVRHGEGSDIVLGLGMDSGGTGLMVVAECFRCSHQPLYISVHLLIDGAAMV